MIAHNVYFTLNNASTEAKQTMIADCKAFVTEIPDIVFSAAGDLVEDMNRPVNDRDFDVHLLVVLKDRAALDVYAVASSHVAFIEKHKANWKQIRVFDSNVE